MPYFAAAVRRSRRSHYSRTHVAQELLHLQSASSTSKLEGAAVRDFCQSPGEEEVCIRRNLKKFFTEFEEASEKNIVRTTPPTTKRVIMSNTQLMDAEARNSPQTMEEGRDSPPSPNIRTSNSIPTGIEKSFKSRRSFDSRQRDVEEIMKKHPHKVPIIVERSKNEKHLLVLDKSKFLVPEELTMSQLTTIIRRRLQLSDTQAFYLMISRKSIASASMTLSEIYKTDKDKDGFLYITYASQEMFG